MIVCIYIFLTDKGSILEFYVLKLPFRCKVQQPCGLQHHYALTYSEWRWISTPLRMRSTGSTYCRNYQSTKREYYVEADKN